MLDAVDYYQTRRNIVKFFCFVLMMSIFLNAQISEASYMNTLEKPSVVELKGQILNLNVEGESVSFVMQDDRSLRMYSRDGLHDYLSFTGYYGNNSGIMYEIRKIEVKSPDKVLIEINTNRGAHGQNVGYWIIGKYKGKWVTFVSLDTLAKFGYTVGEWHSISTNVFGNGKLILFSVHEEMPPGGIYMTQRKHVKDFVADLFWDEKAEWFGIRRL